jgi:predicted aconitase
MTGALYMYLTKEEEAALNGERGEAAQIAMSVLVKLGEAYEADRMIKIQHAHIDAASYATIYEAGLQFCEKMVSAGALFKVPATINPSAIDFEAWRELRVPSEVTEKQIRLARAYIKMGVIPTWTCAPYQNGANIKYGQNVAWGESNAVFFANSVIGARTNRFGDLLDVCAAIIGKVPRFGLYLSENRRGTMLFELQDLPVKKFTRSDYGALGFLIGSTAGTEVPVVVGIPRSVTVDQLKFFGAAAATGGPCALCHIVGVTPEARTLKAATRGEKFKDKVTIDLREFKEVKEKLSTTGDREPDLVAIGCPHCSVEELREIASYLEGRRVKRGVELWIFTSPSAKSLAREMGLLKAIEGAGGMLIAGSCPLYLPLSGWGFKVLITDSAKMAYYAPGLHNVDVVFKDTLSCLKAATTS